MSQQQQPQQQKVSTQVAIDELRKKLSEMVMQYYQVSKQKESLEKSIDMVSSQLQTMQQIQDSPVPSKDEETETEE